MRREIAGFLDSARRRGLRTSLHLLASSIWFDARFGIETRTVLEGSQLGDVQGSRYSGPGVYHAVNPVILGLALARLRTLAPTAISAGCFVDFGSGKGRALVLAASAGFQKVVGIENSPVLHDLCKSNLQAVWRRRPLLCPYELHLGDAATFAVPDDSTVWFWFNPFDAALARRVAENLLASLQRQPRGAYLIYARPAHAAVVQQLGFTVAAEIRSATTHLDALLLRRPHASS